MNIVCCGSNKHFDKIKELCDSIKDDRYTFYLPSFCDKPKEDMNDDTYEELLYNHFKRIHNADIVIIFDYDGYIGHSTSIELGYARALNKYIIALQEPEDESIRCMFDQIMHYNIVADYNIIEDFIYGLNYAYFHGIKLYPKMYI